MDAKKKPSGAKKKKAAPATQYEVLTWPQYLAKLRLGSAADVERELLKDTHEDEVRGFREARYIVVDRVREPDLNGSVVLAKSRERRPPYPPGFKEQADDFYDEDGTEWWALVAIEGDGMPPQTVLG